MVYSFQNVTYLLLSEEIYTIPSLCTALGF